MKRVMGKLPDIIFAMELLYQTFFWAFLVALAVGVVANKTSFCTMGAVSDWINIGDTGRMRAWVLATAVAILGIGVLHSLNSIDMSLANSGITGKPPYTSPQFIWLRYVVGGVLFGIGMTLGSGCGNKTFIRIGGGNIKSVFVLLMMGAGAYLMIYTDFGEWMFVSWMRPVSVDFSSYAIESQTIPDVAAGIFGAGDTSFHLLSAIVLGAMLLAWAFRSADLHARFDNVLGGVTIGIAVVAVWYVTTGSLGQALLEEAEFFDQPHYDLGAQSLTFVKPSAHLFHLIREGFSFSFVSLALVIATGVISGSLLYALLARTFRIEWFSSVRDFISHLVGGFLMGIGGVLSLGCTFGQAITGASTLALGSFMTFAFIVLGASVTMKMQYYRMVYEDDDWFAALRAALADLHLLPQRWRVLDRV